MKIGSWNVNSLSIRLEQVLEWMHDSSADILGIQETKMMNERFPIDRLEALGYHCVFDGQKAYNGVAFLSRFPLLDVSYGLPCFNDPQKRVIAATVDGIRVINVYVPNGAAVGSDKYEYKLSWLQALHAYIEQQLTVYPKLVIMGDFNIAPADQDVHDPKAWEGSVLVSPMERKALSDILSLGLVDSYRHAYPEDISYSWWDYRAGKFQRNHGVRIDLILLSDTLTCACEAVGIDRSPRTHERPSDHVPVWVVLRQSLSF